MKKSLYLAILASGVMLLMTGCQGIVKANNNGFPSVMPGLLYAEMQNAQMVQDKQLPRFQKFVVLKRVQADAVTTNFLGLISIGDASYSLLKSRALADCREADDIIDLEVDSNCNNILGIVNKVTTQIRGVAIKYVK